MLKISSRLVYAAIAGAYLAACFGLDKTLVSAMLALHYLLLAIHQKG